MGLFKPMPDLLGLFIFNLLNVAVLVYALSKLNFPQKRYTFLLLFLVVETGISLSSSQTNLLMAGLIILSFVSFEKKNVALASLFICLTFFIKIFGIVAFALWLLYPQKGKFILYTLLWMALLLMIPALVISPTELMWQYENWLVLLQQDHSASVGISFMGWMYSWFGWNLPKIGTLVVAAALFLLPFLKTNQYGNYLFRIQMVASVLLWIVIFNHKGESPTYIIAMAGVALWYYSQKRIGVNLVLLWLCLVFTSFSSTEAFTPLWVTSRYVVPFSIKAVFCTIIWCKLIFDAMLQKSTPDPELALSEKLG
jgi:hypothetical protein